MKVIFYFYFKGFGV